MTVLVPSFGFEVFAMDINNDVHLVYVLSGVPQSVKVTVAEFLNRVIGKVSEWCDLLGVKLNASVTKTMIISRSRMLHPH